MKTANFNQKNTKYIPTRYFLSRHLGHLKPPRTFLTRHLFIDGHLLPSGGRVVVWISGMEIYSSDYDTSLKAYFYTYTIWYKLLISMATNIHITKHCNFFKTVVTIELSLKYRSIET